MTANTRFGSSSPPMPLRMLSASQSAASSPCSPASAAIESVSSSTSSSSQCGRNSCSGASSSRITTGSPSIAFMIP